MLCVWRGGETTFLSAKILHMPLRLAGRCCADRSREIFQGAINAQKRGGHSGLVQRVEKLFTRLTASGVATLRESLIAIATDNAMTAQLKAQIECDQSQEILS